MESCDLLARLNDQKSGSCPSSGSPSSNEYQLLPVSAALLSSSSAIDDPLSTSTANCNEATTSDQCVTDADCPDTLKCCLTLVDSRCSSSSGQTSVRQCTRALNSNPLLPGVPFNLTITERKKGKTVILSWEASYHAQKPTMFVIEGQWSLQRGGGRGAGGAGGAGNEAELTKWGYLAQTVNQNWVILRSINRGRWYRFRVAAVSKLGSHGYSTPTHMFILSSQPKPPASPENLTVVSASVTSNGRVEANLAWLPSKRSDLPVVFYKLTWKLVDKVKSLFLNYICVYILIYKNKIKNKRFFFF